jgi:aryl-alcohol dehydrogenase-like predicted oxidoreductase
MPWDNACVNYRTLGRTGLQVSELGYGAWGIGGRQWLGGNDADSLTALKRALDLGLNFIDTALAYNEGHSERLIGQVLKETGAKAFVATKVPPKNLTWPAQPGIAASEVFPYDYVLQSTATSLANLGMETVDLQQLHVWNPEWMATDEWRRALEDVKSKGMARFIGISINDHQPESAIDLIRSGLIDTVQVIYNVFDQSPEQGLFPTCMQHNIGVLARVPLDEGALTGAITPDTQFEADDFRASYFRGDRRQQVATRVAALQADLPGNEALAETALRFCLSHPAVTTVIPGMRRVRNVESNIAASERGQLSSDVLRTLRRHAWSRNFYQ